MGKLKHKWSGGELKALHDELAANEVPLCDILKLAKCSTSTLYKIYRDDKNVKLVHVNNVARALLSLRARIQVSA